MGASVFFGLIPQLQLDEIPEEASRWSSHVYRVVSRSRLGHGIFIKKQVGNKDHEHQFRETLRIHVLDSAASVCLSQQEDISLVPCCFCSAELLILTWIRKAGRDISLCCRPGVLHRSCLPHNLFNWAPRSR